LIHYLGGVDFRSRKRKRRMVAEKCSKLRGNQSKKRDSSILLKKKEQDLACGEEKEGESHDKRTNG